MARASSEMTVASWWRSAVSQVAAIAMETGNMVVGRSQTTPWRHWFHLSERMWKRSTSGPLWLRRVAFSSSVRREMRSRVRASTGWLGSRKRGLYWARALGVRRRARRKTRMDFGKLRRVEDGRWRMEWVGIGLFSIARGGVSTGVGLFCAVALVVWRGVGFCSAREGLGRCGDEVVGAGELPGFGFDLHGRDDGAVWRGGARVGWRYPQ